MTNAPPTKNERIAKSNRWAAWRWGSLVVGMLGLQLVLGFVAVSLATNNDAAAVIPNYYEKSLQWDDDRAKLAVPDVPAVAPAMIPQDH